MGGAGKAAGRTGARGLKGPQARTGPANEVQRRSVATAGSQASRVASTANSTFPFSAFEIGHPSFAPSAASWKDACVAPGTAPRTVMWAFWTVHPPSVLSAVISTLTEIRVGGVPAFARLVEMAIENH